MKRIAFAIALALAGSMAFAADIKGDAKFINDASEGGTAEVKFSKLALEHSTDEQVKTFATAMVDQHTKAGDELKALLEKKGLSATENKIADTKKFDDLAKKSGADFDKEYAKVMVDDHKKTVSLFEKEAKSGTDADLKQWASATLPTLKHHLEMAEQLQKDVKNKK